MTMLVRLVAVACLVGGVAGAQDTFTGGIGEQVSSVGGKRPMTFADLQAMKRVSDPQISPSGKWVMFSVTDVSLEKNSKVNHLWVVALGGGGGGEADSSAALRNDNKSALRSEDSKKERQVTFGDGEGNGRFSPDGKWVSVSMKDQIYVAPWDEAKGTIGGAVALTNVSGGADGGIWSPDSKRLLFVASVYPECSDLADWAKEDACDKAKDEAAAKSPVKALIFDHLLYRHWTAFTGDKRSHVLVVDAGDGSRVRDLTPRSVVGDAETPTFSLGGPLGYAWAPDSREIAYVTNLEKVKAASTNNDVFTLRLDEAGAAAKKVSTSPGSDDGPAYSPDGKWLAWRSQARNGFESDKFRLILLDRKEGTTWELMPKFEGWVDEFAWADDTNLLIVSGDRGATSTMTLSIDGTLGSTFNPIDMNSIGEYSDVRRLSGDSIVASRMTVASPSEIVRVTNTVDSGTTEHGFYHFFGTKLEPLTHLNDAALSQLDLAKLEPFWFEGAAGAKVEGFIVKPPNFDPAKKYPVKFLMHGGPQTAWGDAWSYRWNWQLFAADGYVVVGINRRGSTGYGQKFVDEVSGDWGGKAFVDLMKGLDYAEAHYSFIDKDRECALGASYGGFMANWVLTHTDRFKCIVTHDGMYNPQSAYGTTEELWFNEWEFRPVLKAGAGTAGLSTTSAKSADSGRDDKVGAGMVEQTKPAQPWDYFGETNENDPFRKWSPMLHIKDAHTPTLVVHSQKDFRLDVSEGFQMFTALQRLGVPSRMLYFPDEGHWVLKPQNSQLWYETVNDWCDRWLGVGKYASVGPEKNPMGVRVLPRVGLAGAGRVPKQ